MALLVFGLATLAWWALCYWMPTLVALAQALVERSRDDA